MRKLSLLVFLFGLFSVCTTVSAQTSKTGRISVGPVAALPAVCDANSDVYLPNDTGVQYVCNSSGTGWNQIPFSNISQSYTGTQTFTNAICTGSCTGFGGSSSLGSDNIWTNNNRFEGPIPYRDFTAYMPQGGCSSANTNDPPAIGSITSGLKILTVSTAADFKTGCGVAVIGAGPTATITMASTATGTSQICADPPACTNHTGTSLLFTISSGSIPIPPGSGNGSDFAGPVTVTGCGNTGFNTNTTGWLLNFGTPVTSIIYNVASQPGVNSTTGCTVSFLVGWAHGITGSTTYNYKIAPVDSSGGVGPAVGPITITSGNAALSVYNYNWMGWQYTPGAREFLVYSDGGLGGAYSCINVAYSQGYSDWGKVLPFGCPAYAPATPPASATAQTLNTTITSGGGSTTLTLAAAASNTATTQNVYDDVSGFLAQCINAAIADQYPGAPSYRTFGSYGCYIPYGRWPINADMPTDTISAGSSGGVSISVAGTLLFQSWPWMIGSEYKIIGQGNSGGETDGQYFPTTLIERGSKMPAGMIIRGTGIDVENFSLYDMLGHAIMITANPSTGNVTAGITMKQMVPNVQDGYGIGVPLLIDQNTYFVHFSDMDFQPACTTGFPASIYFTSTVYSGGSIADIFFNNIYTKWHHVVLDAPGGREGGQGTSFNVNETWNSEEHGHCPTGGTIALDTGMGETIGASNSGAALAGAYIYNIQNADASNKTLLSITGNQGVEAAISAFGDSFLTTPRCDNGSPDCANGNITSVVEDASGQPSPVTELNGNFPNGVGGSTNILTGSFTTRQTYGQTGPYWSIELAAPYSLQTTSTGSGSLAAGTYCVVAVGLGYNPFGGIGYTIPTPEICQTVGASSAINLQWQLIPQTGQQYTGYRLYFGTLGPGSESQYFVVGTSGTLDVNYTFNTVSGAVSGAVPGGVPSVQLGSAFHSWILPYSGCFGCTNIGFQLGVGDPLPSPGDELSILNGVLHAKSGFGTVLATKTSTYTLMAGDIWVNVTGTTTITVPHANSINQWTVFNSGSNTVTVATDSGNINGGASITLSPNSGGDIHCDGTNCFADLGGGGGGGGGTVNSGTQYAFGYYATGGTAISSGPTPPSVNGNYICGYAVTGGVSVAPTCPLVGLAGRAVTGTTSTDTIGFGDANNVVIHEESVANAVALPTPTTLGNANFFTVIDNFTTGSGTAVTLTAAGSFNINGSGSPFAIKQNYECRLGLDPAAPTTNWITSCGPTQFATQFAKVRCEPGLGDGFNTIAAQTYLQSTCYNDSGVTWTITAAKCFTDNNGSSTMNMTDNSANALLTGAITCSNSYAAGTVSGSHFTIASGGYIKFTFVADGTSKQSTWVVSMTQ